MLKLTAVGIAWLGAVALMISDAVQNQIVTTLGGVLIVALPAFFLYLTQRLNRVTRIVKDAHQENKVAMADIAHKINGLASQREAQLKAAEIDAAAKGGELKAHEQQRADAQK